MASSPNAGFNLQVTGSNNGIWGTNLNSNFSIADGLYGGRVTVNCAGSANITVTTSQAQNFFQNLTGALTGSILYILPATGGQFFILNNTTGAYTITVVNNASGNGVVVPQGGSAYVASDPDNTTVYGVIPTVLALTSLSVSGQITSTQTTGTAPFVVTSTTPVANLSIGGNAATATTASGVTGLSVVSGKTLTVDNSITLAGTDGTTITTPSTSSVMARTDAAQTFTGTQTFGLIDANLVNLAVNVVTVTSNAGTCPVTSGIDNFTNSSAGAMTLTLATSGAVDGQKKIVRIYDFSASAEGITWVNTENSTITAPTSSNGSTTLPLTTGWMLNGATNKWRCVASV